MEDTILHTLLHHWKLIAAIWLISSIIGSMPAPNGGRVTNTWWYKWVYGAAHTAVGNLPTVLNTLFPKVIAWLAKRFFGIEIPK